MKSNRVPKTSLLYGTRRGRDVRKGCPQPTRKDGSLDVPFADPDYYNPKVVCITAAPSEGSSWQRQIRGKWRAAMTYKLLPIFRALGQELSWLNIMAAGGESTKLEKHNEPQLPRSAGVDDRIPFSLKQDPVTELWAQISEKGSILIQGGLSIGMKKRRYLQHSPFTMGRRRYDRKLSAVRRKIRDSLWFSAVAERDKAHLSTNVAFATLVRRDDSRPMEVPINLTLKSSNGLTILSCSEL